MPKQLFKGLYVISLIFFVAGCASSSQSGGGIKTRAYVADQERVDQTMEGGNFGYLAGTPKVVDRSGVKKTRKVYVLEMTKEPPELPEDDVTTASEPAASYTPPVEDAPAEEPRGRRVELPSFDEESAATGAAVDESAPMGGGQEYVVEKNDTLQKISKKFYGTYSKWPQIYEANKTVITNPNRIKEGVVLQIP
jgi:nucleoid-associated protein YgaU